MHPLSLSEKSALESEKVSLEEEVESLEVQIEDMLDEHACFLEEKDSESEQQVRKLHS